MRRVYLVRVEVLQREVLAGGRRLDDEVAGDGGAGAGLVLDDHLLAELPAQGDRHRAPQHVRDAAGGEADHHAYRLAGVIGLRECRATVRGARDDEQPYDPHLLIPAECEAAARKSWSVPDFLSP